MKIENKIKKIATENNWEFLVYQENIKMLSFYNKKSERINIYLTTMTVATCINHPKKGKTQLFRKYIDLNELECIFKNPRTHIGKGYYKKEN